MNSTTLTAHSPSRLSSRSALTLPTWSWLIIGSLLTVLSGMRFNVGIVGWVVATPWLIFLRRSSGWRSRLLFFAALQGATLLAVAKIVTEPIPWFFAPAYSVPIALGGTLLYWIFEALRRRLGDRWGLLLFPALTVVLEWTTTTFTGMGSWGALAYTQLDNLPLLQLTSLFGLSGIAALLAATSALLAVLLDSRLETWRAWRNPALLLATLALFAHGWGSFRLHTLPDGPMVTVATVVADLPLSPGKLPSEEVLQRTTDELFTRSIQAADQGAQLIVWNEGATAVDRAGERALLRRGGELAAAYDVDLVMAYIVPLDGLRAFENKYAWMTPQGNIESYFKHNPVPGEGSVAGSEPLVAHDRSYGRAAGAICYDYDFPAMGKGHTDLGVDLVVLPASDWRGIHPYHTQMAAVRGIEGGFSVVRATRWGSSAAFDGKGVVRGSATDLEGVFTMLAKVPAKRVTTLYGVVGDVLPLLASLLLLVGGWRAMRDSNPRPSASEADTLSS